MSRFLEKNNTILTSTRFGDFFDTPELNGAAPQALGFDGFFKGSYSYHFHNFWSIYSILLRFTALKSSFRWKAFDPARNWPDLGEKFLAGETAARRALREGEAQAPVLITTTDAADADPGAEKEGVEQDKRDLDWAAVLKRTFESYIRGERANMYGEWIVW